MSPGQIESYLNKHTWCGHSGHRPGVWPRWGLCALCSLTFSQQSHNRPKPEFKRSPSYHILNIFGLQNSSALWGKFLYHLYQYIREFLGSYPMQVIWLVLAHPYHSLAMYIHTTLLLTGSWSESRGSVLISRAASHSDNIGFYMDFSPTPKESLTLLMQRGPFLQLAIRLMWMISDEPVAQWS